MTEPADPIARFREVYARACAAEKDRDPSAMTLATADAQGRPSARVVLLKDVDERGFVFYTNFNSRKGRQLAENPHAALCFYWPSIAEQISVSGAVTKVADDEADAYFQSRPRGSQVGAWASRQSDPLTGREELIKVVALQVSKYVGRPIPRPDFWGGFRLIPDRIEFWINRKYRLHDRFLYTLENGSWRMQMLYP